MSIECYWKDHVTLYSASVISLENNVKKELSTYISINIVPVSNIQVWCLAAQHAAVCFDQK